MRASDECMYGKAKKAVLLIFCLSFATAWPTISATTGEENQELQITFDQEDGYFSDMLLNVSGDSTVPLTSIEITLWNISMPEQWSSLVSSPYLNSVVPYSTVGSDVTMWSWEHSFNVTNIDCTCFIEISFLDNTDRLSFGLVVYAGNQNHRPVLRPSSFVDPNLHYSTQIFSGDSIELAFDYLLPPASQNTAPSELSVMTDVRYCPAPYGICSENYSSLSAGVSIDTEVDLSIDINENSILDGYYLLQIQIQDAYLALSNNLTKHVVVDTTPPEAQLTAIESVNESEPIVVDIDVEDGYIESSFVITWTIREPDGSLRSVSDNELSGNNRIEFTASKSGPYTVNALVRDIGGHLVTVSHNLTVANVEPRIVVRFDGFEIVNQSTVQLPLDGTWVFSANETTDTENDRDTLEYFWYVDGKSLLSGQSYLLSSDVKSNSYQMITVTVLDDDGSSSTVTFQVQQLTRDTDSLSDSSFYSVIALFFVLATGLVVLLRRRALSDSGSGFAKWTERAKGPKN